MQFENWENDQPQSSTGLGGLRNFTGEFRWSSLITYYNGYPFICERKITEVVDREMFKNSNGTYITCNSNLQLNVFKQGIIYFICFPSRPFRLVRVQWI